MLGTRSAIVLLCFFLHVIDASPACHLETVMDCVNNTFDFLETLPKRTVPDNKEDMDGICQTWVTEIKCFHTFIDKCMSPMQKELQALFSEGLWKLKTDICVEGDYTRNRYMTYATCYNEVLVRNDTIDYFNYILAILDRMRSTKHPKLQYLCCGIGQVYQKFYDAMNATCGEDSLNVLGEMVTVLAAEIPTAVCPDIGQPNEECSLMAPEDGAKPSEEFKKTTLYYYLTELLKHFLD